jgi:hypothetical protein
MDEIGIEIGRIWDNVDDEGWFSVNDGSCRGKIRTGWEAPNHLIKMGKALSRFPRKIPDKYSYEIRQQRGFPHSYLALRAHADNTEHALLEVMMKGTDEEADHPQERDIFTPVRLSIDLVKSQTRDEFDGEVLVSFKVEHLAIHRLGELLLKFSERHRADLLKYRILRWSTNPDKDELVEFEHPKSESLKRHEMDPAFAEWERLKKKHPTPEEKKRKKGWTFGPNPDWWNPG